MGEGNKAEESATGERAGLESRALALVEALARELDPRRAIRPTPSSLLQRDLGFDSLALAELVLRAERRFRVRLPDDVLDRLATPADLASEVAAAGGAEPVEAARRSDRLPSFAIEDRPDDAATLIEVLDWHVRHNGERTHLLISDGYRESEVITYLELWRAARRLAAGLLDWGLAPGERVGIMLPTGAEFFEAFFGVLLAGAVPVPMYPPMRLSQIEEHLRRQAGILRNCGAGLMFVPQEGRHLAAMFAGTIGSLRAVATVAEMRGQTSEAPVPARRPEDLALLQYTSGSTGDPKGVMLTHANLLANIRAMGRAIGASSRDIFVSWLPLYHDLGLIGAWLGSLYFGAPVIVQSPLRFIIRPESWLWAIQRNAATLTAAPNFAFDLCVDKVPDSAIEGLDLSSLRMVANGAEKVGPETIRRFTERFARYGFRPEAMTPVYGLAENAVGLAFSPVSELPRIDRIARAPFSRGGLALPAGPEEAHPVRFVSGGLPLPGHEVRIVDRNGRELPERHEGRLEFRGPSATAGYFGDPVRSAALVRDGWLDSGDLAYVAGGHVFITGRIKDIVIKEGRNIYPEEIEMAVGDLPGIRKGCVAAFASPDPASGSERLVVVAETRRTDPSEREGLRESVARTVSDILGLPADEVIIAPPHAVPKTSSGKIRRSSARQLYEAGELGRSQRAAWAQMLRLRLVGGVARLRRAGRAVADLAHACRWWGVIGLGGALTWLAVLALPGRRLRWATLRAMSRLALALAGTRLAVSGRERLGDGAGVTVVNHASYLDALVLSALLPGAPVFVAKRDLAGQRIAGPFLRRLGVLFADRDLAQAGVREAQDFADRVRAGERLVIFPEATLRRMPGLLPFRLGAFVIACGTGTGVRPVVIRGTRSILRGEQWFPRRGRVEVEVLEALSPDGDDFAAAVRLRERTRSRMLAACGEPDLAGDDVGQIDHSGRQAGQRG